MTSKIELNTAAISATYKIHLFSKLFKNDISTQLAKALTAIDRQSDIWKSDMTDKIKHSFLPSSSRIDTTLWMHHAQNKLDCNSALNWSWRQHPTKQQPYDHLRSITKTI